MPRSKDHLKERAKKVLERGEAGEIDLKGYDYGEPGEDEVKPEELPEKLLRRAEEVGIDLGSVSGGTYLQIDHNVAYTMVTDYLKKQGVLIMSTLEALERLEWVKEYYWKAMPVDTDKFTAMTELNLRHGYFIYVPAGVKIDRPIQACLMMRTKRIAQPVHNIIIVDKGADITLVTGCAAMVNEGLHIGVSEFYVKEGARVNFIMIHGWAPDFNVRPRTAVIVEREGTFTSYYVNLYPVRNLQMEPRVYLHAKARGYLTSILLGKGDSTMDVGGRLEFVGRGSRGEIISRSIITDQATVIMRGRLIGRAAEARGHLECRGLLLSPSARSKAIPELEAVTEGAELTHEAAIGRISEEELNYLMARGFTEEEATSLIVRGFLDVGLDKMPRRLQASLRSILDTVAKLSKG